MGELTKSRLRELLDYDEFSGVFTWRGRTSNRIKVGDQAGAVVKEGYRIIRIDGRLYLGARLAWLFVHGEWPDGQIDHINHVRDDDRIKNLRVVTHQENGRNQKMPSNNKSGVVGVRWQNERSRWVSYITVSGRRLSLYAGKDLMEACCQRKSAEVRYEFHSNHGVRS